MTYDFRAQRLFVRDELRGNAEIEAERSQANYLLNVLRLREDDAILLFNGRDGEWRAKVMVRGRKSCRLVVEEKTRDQTPASDLHYLFAPLKQARLDYMVQKAVEMGAGRLRPVLTQYTQVRRVNLERMQANAIEAAEQCGILSIPAVDPPRTLEEVLASWDTSRRLIFCDESADSGDLNQALGGKRQESAGILIGPEGGFSPEERGTLLAQSYVTPLSLGPRILRADTAAVAALAVVQAFIGDWR